MDKDKEGGIKDLKDLVNFWTYNYFKIIALSQLLIKKGIITREEIIEQFNSLEINEEVKKNYLNRLESEL